MAHMAVATAEIAAFLRMIVPILRSAMLKGVWNKFTITFQD